jgi:arylsulfatase A-like enzyme
VIQLDLLPTALAAAGVTADPAWKLDGVNLLPYLGGQNNQPPHDVLYWRFGKQMAIRQGDWKVVKYDDTPAQLYNLADDIGEKHDLAAKQPEKFRQLDALWQKWNATLVAPLWAPARLP